MPIDKVMQGQMQNDAWKDAEKTLSQKSAPKPPPMHQLARKPDQFEPIAPDKNAPSSGLKTANEMGVGGVGGFQVPLGMQKRKEAIDKVLEMNPDIGEGAALAYLASLKEGDDECNQVGNMLDMGDHVGVGERMRMHAVRELVRKKVREVVRKKEGGGGYVLYAPNRGKKGKPKAVGTFPTKLGAKRAELARNPPKDPSQLQRLRKYVKKLTKKPNDEKKPKKHEGLIREADQFQPSAVGQMQPAPSSGQTRNSVRDFLSGIKTLQKGSPQYNSYVSNHAKLLNPAGPQNLFRTDVEKQDKVLAAAGKPTITSMLTGQQNSKANAGFKPGQTVARAESIMREHMERKVISVIIRKQLVERAMFKEEASESEWDDYITKLSKSALNGDSKFQNLQKNITRRTEDVLDDAFVAIKKSLGKSAAAKNHGIKAEDGTTFLMFSADLGEMQIGPIAIAIEGGRPKIHLSPEAKQALMQVDPNEAKMFRAELISVQEAILDEMDDLSKATQARDKYLQKLEGNVDAYVSGLSPLEISVLKNLLTKKYRKIA